MSGNQRFVPLEVRFASKFVQAGPDECWPWTGAKRKGRGAIWVREYRRVMEAPRVALMLAGRPVPDDMEACHVCDNGACVNPNHLFIGTHAENMADMMRKGRHRTRPSRGQDHYYSALTAEVVLEILRHPELTLRELASRFHVSRSAISHVRKGRTWTHITGLPRTR